MMRFFRVSVMASLVLASISWMPFDAEAQSGEDNPDPRQFGELSNQGRSLLARGFWGASDALGYPSGEKLDAPQSLRFWRYRDEDSLPMCYTLAQSATFSTVFEETFTPDPGTDYVWINLSSQMTVSSGTSDPYQGVLLSCEVEQVIGGVVTTLNCPWAGGEGGAPFFGRRDNTSVGQQQYGLYQGVVKGVDPSYDVTVRIRMRSTDGTSYACYTNLTVLTD